jgi:hypothetical protein
MKGATLMPFEDYRLSPGNIVIGLSANREPADLAVSRYLNTGRRIEHAFVAAFTAGVGSHHSTEQVDTKLICGLGKELLRRPRV